MAQRPAHRSPTRVLLALAAVAAVLAQLYLFGEAAPAELVGADGEAVNGGIEWRAAVVWWLDRADDAARVLRALQ